jgi:hypothetical protein
VRALEVGRVFFGVSLGRGSQRARCCCYFLCYFRFVVGQECAGFFFLLMAAAIKNKRYEQERVKNKLTLFVCLSAVLCLLH